jgi:hypothetical protein
MGRLNRMRICIDNHANASTVTQTPSHPSIQKP